MKGFRRFSGFINPINMKDAFQCEILEAGEI